MVKLILSAKEIYELDFPTVKNGYDTSKVEKYLDNIIKDYVQFDKILEDYSRQKKVIVEQQREITKLKQQLSESHQKTQLIAKHQMVKPQPVANATNLDLLKRVANLEMAVFGKKSQ